METNVKTPPHSAEAERSVLGSILLGTETDDDTRVLDLCLSRGLVAEAFYEPRHRLLFETLVGMSRATLPLDMVTLNERLRTTGNLDAVGGVAAIQGLVEATPTAAHAEYYVEIVKQKYLLRRMIDTARNIERRCFEDTEGGNAQVLLGEMEQKLLSLGDDGAGGRASWASAVDATLASIQRMFGRKAGMLDGLSTGFRHVDEKLLGLRKAEMIVIAARPSVGKTSFAMNIAECVATGTDVDGNPCANDGGKKHPVLVFSLEMDALSLTKRMMCGRARVSSWSIARNLLAKDQKAAASSALFRAANEIRDAPIYVDDSSGLDVADLRARARRLKRQHGIELIVIDYLQLCKCREYANQGRQQEVSAISGQIKSMAKELQIPVIVLSQLSRANEQRGDKYEKPKLSDLRDSGAIEQDADVVMLLRRPQMIQALRDDPKLANMAYVDVAKHRNGETGEVKMNFFREYTRFGNRSQKDETAEEETRRADRDSAAYVDEPEDPAPTVFTQADLGM